jgi:hypothetical protein
VLDYVQKLPAAPELIDAVAHFPGLSGSRRIVRVAARKGATLVEFRQGFRFMTAPTRELENASLTDGRKGAETAMRRGSPRWG